MKFRPLYERVVIRRLNGEELLIMKESDIMGVIEGVPAGEKMPT